MSNPLITAALRTGRAVVGFSPEATADPAIGQAAAVELARLGFLVDPRMLETTTTESLTELLASASEVAGGDRDMTPIYPEFPAQVKASDTLTLLVEQLLHYITAGQFLPQRPEQPACRWTWRTCWSLRAQWSSSLPSRPPRRSPPIC